MNNLIFEVLPDASASSNMKGDICTRLCYKMVAVIVPAFIVESTFANGGDDVEKLVQMKKLKNSYIITSKRPDV